MPEIHIENVRKTYPKSDTPALDGVNLSIDKGEFFGLLGPNGAGKTTLMSIMCGLLRPTDGMVHVQDSVVKAASTRLKQALGVAPQDLALYPRLTGRENLRYFARMHGLGGALLNERVDHALHMAGLMDAAERLVSTYSGGMKRRANLVAAILHEPDILVLDEPTVGIDAQSRNVIFESLKALNAEGMTVVYTTHYMEEAQTLCSRVAVIDRGRIVADGGPRRLVEDIPDCANLEDVFLALTGRQLRD